MVNKEASDYYEAHRVMMQTKLRHLMRHFSEHKKQATIQKRIASQRATRTALQKARVITPPVRKIIQEVCDRYGVPFEDVIGASRQRRCCDARIESLAILYRTFPGKGWEWYARPFGYAKAQSAAQVLRDNDLIPGRKSHSWSINHKGPKRPKGSSQDAVQEAA